MNNVLGFWRGHDLNKIAFEQEQNILTYKELEDVIEEKVRFFRKIGIKEYDHIILSINDQLVYMQIFLALWSMNVTIIPLDFQINYFNLREIVKESDANYIISNKIGIQQNFETDIHSFPNLKGILLVNKEKIQVININDNLNKDSWLDSKSIPNTVGFFMLFTSGTSGKCKGVILKKESFLRNVDKVIQYTHLNDSDILLINLPLSYSFALSQVCAHLMIGGKVILSANNVYNGLILYEIKEKNVTNYPATPYFYETLAKEIKNNEDLDVGKLKFFMSAGGYINPFVIETIVKKFPNIAFYNNYGQTEASPRISYNCFDSNSVDYKGAGKPLSGVEIAIFDDNGNIQEEGQIGEIVYKSEDLMLGYYKDKIIDNRNYFMSGDLGVFENDNLIIVGRKDSLIKINGRKVYKNYIENSIFMLPYVSNVKIKKARHEIYGEYFIAYVVPKKGEDEKAVINKIYDFCKINFNSYERPKKIVICNEITLSTNKKVQLSV